MTDWKARADIAEACVAEYDTLFDLARNRERPWIEAWRKASNKPETLPDYGEMLNWLCGQIETAEARVAVLTEALINIKAQLREVFMEDDWEADCLSIFEKIRAALATTPAEALERARAVEAKGYAAGLEAAAKCAEKHKRPYTTYSENWNRAIAETIRALGKKGP